MNDKKICFIWNVKNEEYYQESVKYVDNLVIPSGFVIEKAIATDKNYAKAYNLAMASSDAKYKVYLQESTFILNKNFIHDVLAIFQNDEIGLVGILGARTIPTSGIWQDSRNKVGKKYISDEEKVQITAFEEILVNNYEEVKALDGVLLVSQQDIPWREDIFTGRYYYDCAQGIEFRKREYKQVVARQEQPWCLYDVVENESNEEYQISKDVFLKEYSSDIYPLVSILIPTYNRPNLFKIALESAINQTYRNIEIIVGDDSTNEDTKQLIQPYLEKYKQIRYINNNGPLGNMGKMNAQNIYEKSYGEYINYLLDDDVFHPEKIAIMMKYYLERENISLVTSYRQLIDENGNYLPDSVATKKMFQSDTAINGESLGRFVIGNFLNVIGEPTTVLLKRKDIDGMFGNYLGRTYNCLVDITQWLELLRRGNAIYIADTLSYFRKHTGQNQNNSYLMMTGAIDSFNFINDSYNNGYFIKEKKEYLNILNIWLDVNKHYLDEKDSLKQYSNYQEQMFEQYLLCVQKVQQTLEEHCKCKCNICNRFVIRFLPWKGYISDFVKEYCEKYNAVGSDIENFSCPHCGSHDRMRHLFMFFNKLNVWEQWIANKTILHIAPELHLQQVFLSLNLKEYVGGDLYPDPNNQYIRQVDITRIQYPDEYFDFIMCSHVLEHIPNDVDAMKELYRVLKTGGVAILQTPYLSKKNQSFEDDSIQTEQQRVEYYGQGDHVRIYGTDLFERLQSVGFKMNIVKNNTLFSREECKFNGVNYEEDLIMVMK